MEYRKLNSYRRPLEELKYRVEVVLMNQKLMSSLAILFTVVLISSLTSVFAQANVGVKVGQTFQITYGFSGTVRDYSDESLNSTLPYYVENIETDTIEEIDGTNVTFRSVRDYLNGTKTMGRFWIDVGTGDGTAWLVVIAPNREAGDMVYPNWVNENFTTTGAFRINSTVQLSYDNQIIDANYLQRRFMNQNQTEFYSYNYYWDKSTGLLLKVTLSSAIIDENLELVHTLNTHLHTVGLQQIFYPYIDNDTFPIAVDSFSSLLGFEFDETQKSLSLNLTGIDGTSGHCDVFVPINFLRGPFTLEMDDYPLVKGTDYDLVYNGTHYRFGINYTHSTHNIDIVASEINPENPAPSEPIELEDFTTEPTTPDEPEPTEETQFITNEMIIIIIAILAVIALIGIFLIRKRK